MRNKVFSPYRRCGKQRKNVKIGKKSRPTNIEEELRNGALRLTIAGEKAACECT